ncbi:MAG: cation transporter [Clostridiales bacterium]|jgi:copper ion binding protein|nr:cation transporter [Clostridiales bacterium]
MAKKTLKVGGMSCDHCVGAVTAAIKSQPGTMCVKVDLGRNTASFQYNPEKATLEQITQAIAEAGYEVGA